jgi:demethoxyubiquinone hydroxylase (CLK1/Coq7/Cat5 family)
MVLLLQNPNSPETSSEIRWDLAGDLAAKQLYQGSKTKEQLKQKFYNIVASQLLFYEVSGEVHAM